ncbi:MAG: hypothetical protein AAF483_04460 [Planctomycetota bacterium]
MPKQYENFGLSFMYPDNWTCDEELDSQTVMVESPEGAFLSVTDVGEDMQDAISQAKEAMEADYDEIEEEPLQRDLAGNKLEGVSLSFVYLDLIVRAHLVELEHAGHRYFLQIQAEDRDMTKLEQVFDAILLSICQGGAKEQA